MAFSRNVVMPYLIGPMLFSLAFPRKIHDIEYLWASAHCVVGFVKHDKVVESDLPAMYSLLERAVTTQGHDYHAELLSVAQELVARFGTDDLSSGIPKSVPFSWYLASGIPPPET